MSSTATPPISIAPMAPLPIGRPPRSQSAAGASYHKVKADGSL
jgi:hypothetical protein